MVGLYLGVALAAGFVSLIAIITVFIYEVSSRVEIIAHKNSSPVLSNLPTLQQYKRPLWLSWSSILHSMSTLIKTTPNLHYRRTIVQTRNGHHLPCDWLEEGIDDPVTPLVVVIPGVTGHSRSPYLVHLVKAINESGKRVVVLTHPGMGDTELKSPKMVVTYETSDLQDRIDAIHAEFPDAHMQCFAYSLGACMLINYLGAVGEDSPVASAVTVSNPFDVHAVASYLQSYFLGRHLFDRHFTTVYRDLFMKKKDLFVQAYSHLDLDTEKLENAVSVFEWDEHFSRRAYGFSSIEEYYYVSSCVRNLAKIKIPLLVVHAADDPIAPLSVVPIDRLKSNPNIITAITEHGGHSGWLEGMIPWNRPAWVDRVACEWIDTILKHQVPHRKDLSERPKTAQRRKSAEQSAPRHTRRPSSGSRKPTSNA